VLLVGEVVHAAARRLVEEGAVLAGEPEAVRAPLLLERLVPLDTHHG